MNDEIFTKFGQVSLVDMRVLYILHIAQILLQLALP